MEKLFTLLLIILCFSCQQGFNRQKWDEVEDNIYFPYRKYMIDDLVNNHHLKGKTHAEIVNLLGRPQTDLDSMDCTCYNVDIDFGFDIDPVYSKTLILCFSKDSVVSACKVEEWSK